MTLSHIGISVSDLEYSIKWYKEFFGFEEMKRFEKKEFEIKVAFLSRDGINLELICPYNLKKNIFKQATLTEALRIQGLNHIAIIVDNIKEFFFKLKSRNVILITDLIEDRFFFCQDPDGMIMEIKQK